MHRNDRMVIHMDTKHRHNRIAEPQDEAAAGRRQRAGRTHRPLPPTASRSEGEAGSRPSGAGAPGPIWVGRSGSYVRYWAGAYIRQVRAGAFISVHLHAPQHLVVSLTRRAGPQKPSSRLSEGYICRIADMNFAEFPF